MGAGIPVWGGQMMSAWTLNYTAASRRGSRKRNEDNLRVDTQSPYVNMDRCFLRSFTAHGTLDTDTLRVFCVCDGVGGAARGDLASRRALEAIDRYLSDDWEGGIDNILLHGAREAHEAVADFCQELGAPSACTLVMLGIRGNEYACLNIGDSPAFRLKRSNREMVELSQRHNLEWEKRRNGMTPHPGDSSQLMHYLGQEGFDVFDMAHIESGTLGSGDVFLLCSDGVSEAYPPEELEDLLNRNFPARELATHAARQPYADNCTAIQIKMRKGR